MEKKQDIEQLVRKLSEQVLSRLQPPKEPEFRSNKHRICLVLPGPSGRLESIIQQAEKLCGLGYPIKIVATSTVAALFAESRLSKHLGAQIHVLDQPGCLQVLCDLTEGDFVVIGILGFAAVNRLTNFEDDNLFVRLISQAMLAGMRILAVKDDLTASPVVQSSKVAKQARQQLRDLEKMGINLIALSELTNHVQQMEASHSTLSQAAGKLVTEDQIEAIVATGERRLVLPPKTIVTPLARSRATALGLELIKDGS